MKIGTISFKDSASSIFPLSLKVEEQLSNKYYLHLCIATGSVDSRKYIQQKWNEIMQHVSEIEVEEMQLADNDYEPILKEISTISFPNLTSLSLISNNIKSIQSLCQVQMPSLKILYICRNNISRLSPMKKTYWPNLTSLIFNDNPIVDSQEVLPQCYFPTLNFIIMEGWTDSHVFAMDISFLFKVQTTSLQYLNIQSQMRINRPSTEIYLLEKWKELRVNVGQ